MNVNEAAKKLIAMGKKGFCPNYQDNRLLMEAGRKLLELTEAVEKLNDQVQDLQERIAIMAEMDPEGRDDTWPPDMDAEEAAADEAPDGFWDDDWPLST